MLNLAEIIAAHSKVKSGADFPAYIQELQKLGVVYYEVAVSDGQCNYFGIDADAVSSPAKYEKINIAWQSNPEQFKKDLQAHQSGKTSYLTFCNDCARSGVEKWVVSIKNMTCIYFDQMEQMLLLETIPE